MPRALSFVGGRQGSHTAILSAIQVYRFHAMCQVIMSNSVLGATATSVAITPVPISREWGSGIYIAMYIN
jgi:hypothetical protein